MLMLGVTIMLAALASAFAGGFAETPDKTPQSTVKVRADLDHNLTYFDHAGGDPFSLDSVKIVLRSGENKTTIRRSDIGTLVVNLTQAGGNETVIRAGDTFVLESDTPRRTLADHSGLRFGETVFYKNEQISWMIVDTRTSRTIAMGSLYL
jgi:FlaG/FlaF family flagellin (archaellin)